MVVSGMYAAVSCSYCGVICEGGTMYALSADSSVRYCSEKCITADYPVHSSESGSISALEKMGVEGGMDSMRLVFRVACCRKNEESLISSKKVLSNIPVKDGISQPIPLNGRLNSYKHIQLLEANKGSITPEMADEVFSSSWELTKICNQYNLPLSHNDIQFLLYAIQCNAHQILNPEGKAIALGLFPYTSMMNHSCRPNCIKLFLIQPYCPPKLIMRAIRDIDKGEELCYSYVNLYQSTETRREQLTKAYSFHCICQRCSTSIDTDTTVENALNGTDSAVPAQTNPKSAVTSIPATFDTDSYLDGSPSNSSKAISEKNNNILNGCDLNSECEIKMSMVSDEALSALEPIEGAAAGEGDESHPTSYNVINQMDDFLSLLTSILSSDIQSIQKVLFKLKEFLNGKKVRLLHPAHKSLFQCYHLYCLTTIQLFLHVDFGKQGIEESDLFDASKDDEDEDLDIAELEGTDIRYSYVDELQDTQYMIQGAVGYGILALGCLKKYVGHVQTEIGHLEEQVVIAIESLLKFNAKKYSEEQINGIKKSLVNDLSRLSFDVLQYDSIASLISFRGYLGQFHWSLKNDSRIIDLLNHACDCQITGNMSITSNEESDSNIPCNEISVTLNTRLPSLGSSVQSTSSASLASSVRSTSFASSVKSTCSDNPDEQTCVASLEETKDSRQKIEDQNMLQNIQQNLKQSASKVAFICRVEV
eukprot:CAMPEP_0119050410 /NCGR_PEP_ID=MMETSP1177-20130426/69792_1 /TAXON_ID=2985 /ORGANISM="Ochromonas sp, Strain CCMP1899" /LENGTH=705 /DNA_ID=CAMNT_0007028775 /DNA_START=178 /DNA_END=2298 /DNA_ORIENTATION=-